MKAIVLSKSKVRYTWCSDSSNTNKKKAMCYIHLREVGGNGTFKNEFWAKICGISACQTFKPGQKVEVELSFHVYRNSHKSFQRVVVDKISHVEDFSPLRLPWDD